MISMSEKSLGQALKIKEELLEGKTQYDIIKILLLDLGQFNQYKDIYTLFLEQLNKIFNKFEFKNREFIIDDVTINSDI